MTLLKALNILVNEKNIRNIKVIFVGSGATLEDCKKYVSDNNLQKFVEFRKEIDHTKLNDFYNSLDLFVLPSYYEAFGCVYTEALQTGTPIIAVEGQGIEEVIKDGDKSKYIIKKRDEKSLAKHIQSFMTSPVKSVNYDFNINTIISSFLENTRNTSQ